MTGSQRDGILDRTPIEGSTLIVNRGTYLPNVWKERVLSSMSNEIWLDRLARLNYYLAWKGDEPLSMTEMMDIIWENLKCSATEDTLRGSLRIRDVTAIIKLKFGLSAGEIQLEHVLEGMMPPEPATISILKPPEPQDEVFIVGREYVVKKARSYEEMDSMPSNSQSPSRKRIRSDSDTWED